MLAYCINRIWINLTYFLDPLLVSLLETSDIVSPLLGFFDLFPSLHLLLLQKGNSVCEQLGISLDTINIKYTIRPSSTKQSVI